MPRRNKEVIARAQGKCGIALLVAGSLALAVAFILCAAEETGALVAVGAAGTLLGVIIVVTGMVGAALLTLSVLLLNSAWATHKSEKAWTDRTEIK